MWVKGTQMITEVEGITMLKEANGVNGRGGNGNEERASGADAVA